MRLATALILSLLVLSTSGCAGLIMTVSDRDGSNPEVALANGEPVGVAVPSIAANLSESIAKAKMSEAEFAGRIQTAMVSALKSRGVNAVTGSGTSTLKIHISNFTDGSGAARFLLSGSGIGDSTLDGTATLTTAAGRRELEIRKTGSKSGTAASGSQTEENIGYFTTALASKIVKSE